jgi:AcrR family transcriptional regulator
MMNNPAAPSGSTSPNVDKKTTTKIQILQSALTCFAGKGYHKTTMDDIVTESGLSKGALYWHFKSKQELFIALVEWFLFEMEEEIAHAWTDEMSAADKIRAMARVTLDSSEQLVPFFNVFLDFWAQTSSDEQLRKLFDKMLTDYQIQLTQIIEEGIASGEFRPVNGSQLSLALFGMMDALLLYRTLLGTKIDMQSCTETALEVILTGLKP